MALGQLGHIGLVREVVWGTPVSPVTDYCKFVSETLTKTIEEVVSAGISGRRDEPQSYEGFSGIAGDVLFEVFPIFVGHLLRSFAGAPITTEQASFEVTVDNQFFDFKEDAGSVLLGTVVAKTYLMGESDADSGSLCEAIKTALEDTGSGTYTVTFSNTTKKITIAVAGTVTAVEFLWESGTNGSSGSDKHIGTLIGFSDTVDSASQASHTGENVVVTIFEHVFQTVSGARDTGTTTTGTDGNSVKDSAKSWTKNLHQGRWVHILTGSGAGAYGIITANDTTSLTVATSPAAAVGDTYEIIDGPKNCLLTPYTLEIHRDLETAFQYAGCITNVLSFTYGVAAKILQVTASLLAKDEAPIAKTTPSLETQLPFLWHQGQISIGVTPYTDIETLTFTLNNGAIAIPLINSTKVAAKMIGDAFRMGTITPTFHIQDLTEFNKLSAWSQAAWEILFEGATIKGALKYTLKFGFPKVLYTVFPVNVVGPGRITVGASGKIKYDSTLGYMARITLINTKASY